MTVNLLQQQQQLQRENLKVSFDHLAGGKASGKWQVARVASAAGRFAFRICIWHLVQDAPATWKQFPVCNAASFLFGGVWEMLLPLPRGISAAVCRLLLHLAKMSIVQSLDISRKTRNSRKHKTRDLCAHSDSSAVGASPPAAWVSHRVARDVSVTRTKQVLGNVRQEVSVNCCQVDSSHRFCSSVD